MLKLDRATVLAGLLGMLLVVAGMYYVFFTGGEQRLKVYPTEGVVMFQGNPAVGARVYLHPEGETANRFIPSGTVAADGSFKLTTYHPDDGAPAGRYRVAIVRGRLSGEELTALKKKHTPEEVEQILAENARDPLYSKYANAGLPTITVPAEPLRFDLE